MSALSFDPWDWLRENGVDPEPVAAPDKTLATLATLAASGWPNLPADMGAGLIRLSAAKAPRHIPDKRWRTMVRDALGLADIWAGKAVALGWSAVDLFGVNPAPGTRLDRDGLATLLDGRPVVAVTADAAALMSPGGGILHYRRKFMGASVPIWTLVEDASDDR